ncbi:TadE/TadG family type IV pilus assembly protein [Nocardioides campestrisoli]|uniref:TadE/TadG family type IV pilus assembly protein n=1 Tax=Nocardioides campestrisoli TaxID=2736757 RepID=UPI00163D600C|nr:TadE family protein [Nocardioides campestrisoli]
MSRPRPARSSSRLRRRNQQGSVSIELLIVLPALFAVLFLGMQAALFHHARTVAIAAAQQGAREAGAMQGRESDGVGAATAFIAEAGGDDVLTHASASANRTAARATVTVTGFSLSVIPGWKVRITQSATVPVERLTSPTAAGS